MTSATEPPAINQLFVQITAPWSAPYLMLAAGLPLLNGQHIKRTPLSGVSPPAMPQIPTPLLFLAANIPATWVP